MANNNAQPVSTQPPETAIFGPVSKMTEAEFLQDLQDCFRDELGEGVHEYYWQSRRGGYYHILLEIKNWRDEVDPCLSDRVPASDWWFEVRGERYRAREDRGEDEPRDHITLAHGRIWPVKPDETWIGIACEADPSARTAPDVVAFQNWLLEQVGQITNAKRFDADQDALRWSLQESAACPALVGPSGTRIVGPLVFRRRYRMTNLYTLLNAVLGDGSDNWRMAIGDITYFVVGDPQPGPPDRISLFAESSDPPSADNGSTYLARITPLASPAYTTYLQIEQGNAAVAEQFCAKLVSRLLVEQGVTVGQWRPVTKSVSPKYKKLVKWLDENAKCNWTMAMAALKADKAMEERVTRNIVQTAIKEVRGITWTEYRAKLSS